MIIVDGKGRGKQCSSFLQIPCGVRVNTAKGFAFSYRFTNLLEIAHADCEINGILPSGSARSKYECRTTYFVCIDRSHIPCTGSR